MKLRPISDLHLAHYPDGGRSFIEQLKPLSEDEVLVLAGDIVDSCAKGNRLKRMFAALAPKWKHIVYVLGNHEYYSSAPVATHRAVRLATASFPNVHWLHNESIEISGVKFYGGTMWFTFDNLNQMFQHWMSDFSVIKSFNPWVYEQHALFMEGFKKIDPGTVVVSHHLPSWKSVHEKYRWGPGANLNRFFVADVESEIVARKPSIFIHGHTHEMMDYKIGPTRIIANPRGYPLEGKSQFREELIVEVPSEEDQGNEAD